MALKIDPAEYIKDFAGGVTAGEKHRNALATALDVRKFEIELYWKRAAYFWTFNAAVLAGYFILRKGSVAETFEETFVLGSLGLVFSIAWFFVNRGSKIWQRNWEAQVDLLEDEIQGPLYKSVLGRYDHKLFSITDPYPFSVTQINQILNVFLTFIWVILLFLALFDADYCSPKHIFTIVSVFVLTVSAILILCNMGRTNLSDDEIEISMRRRVYSSLRVDE